MEKAKKTDPQKSIDPNSIALGDIRAFVTIAEQGSFTLAATILGASRAHLSRQLGQLETRLGVQLIVRTTRTQRLTDAGENLFKTCRQSLSDIDHALVSTTEQAGQLNGKVTVNCVGGMIGEQVIGDLINRFTNRHPGITVDLDFSSQRVDLIGEGVDLVIRMGKLEDSGLIARKLTDIKIETLASPAYFSRFGQPGHPDELEQHNCMTGSVTRWHFRQKSNRNKTLDVSVNGNLHCKNGRVLLGGALAGNGIVRLPIRYCEPEIEQGLLLPVFQDWTIEDVPLFLIYHKSRHQPRRIATLIDFLVAQFPK